MNNKSANGGIYYSAKTIIMESSLRSMICFSLMLIDQLKTLMAGSAIPMILLRADAPFFTIVAYNSVYEKADYTHNRNIIGWTLWEAFDPEAGGGGENVLYQSLIRAIETNEAITTLPFKYNIPSVQTDTWAECWWQLDIVPVGYDDNKPGFLLVNVYKLNYRIGLPG